MIKMKKILAGFTAFTMLGGIACLDNPIISEITNTVSVSALNLDVTGKGSEGDFYCEYCSDGSIIITGYFGSETSITIPEKINGYTVKYLLAYDYKDDWGNLKEINTPSNMLFLAFDKKNIGYDEIITVAEATNIFMSIGISLNGANDEIDIMEGGCGENCTYKFNSVTGTLIISGIGNMKFEFCPWSTYKENIKSVIIQDGVTRIEERAFSYCTSLTKIIIPDSVTSIGYGAFAKTPLLENQTTDVKYVEKWAVDCNEDVTEVEIKPDTVGIADSAFICCSKLTSINIPNSVICVGTSAFEECKKVVSINIPDSVVSIGPSAFRNCKTLTKIKIPYSITNIGEYNVFSGCENLEEIDVDLNNQNYSSENGVLFNKDKTEIINYPNGKSEDIYEIPNSVVNIGFGAFENCTSLTKITIPDSVANIGIYAFSECTSLTEIIIPNSVITINQGAFQFCSSLNKLTIGNSVINIGNVAFNNCESLTSVTIPASVTSIGTLAFGHNYSGSLQVGNFTIYGVKGTAAETYAIKNEFNFVEIGSEPAAKTGDIDGDGETTSSDALNVLQAVVGSADLTDEQKKLADLNGDGEITSADALFLLQIVVGLR